MIQIREVRTDSPVAVVLLREYVADRVATRPPAAGGYQAPQPDPALFLPPQGTFVVGAEGDEVLGCAGIRSIVPGPEWVDDGFGGSRWYELKHLFTRPEARGRGVARRLLEHLTIAAREFGGDRLVLDTHSSLDAASGLYARAGLREVPRFNDNSNADRWYGKEL
ncbi:hypothetical protein GCM10028820_22750 [Tessaracoccus terricola]